MPRQQVVRGAALVATLLLHLLMLHVLTRHPVERFEGAAPVRMQVIAIAPRVADRLPVPVPDRPAAPRAPSAKPQQRAAVVPPDLRPQSTPSIATASDPPASAASQAPLRTDANVIRQASIASRSKLSEDLERTGATSTPMDKGLGQAISSAAKPSCVRGDASAGLLSLPWLIADAVNGKCN